MAIYSCYEIYFIGGDKIKIKFTGKNSLSSFVYWLLIISFTVSVGCYPFIILSHIVSHGKGIVTDSFYEIENGALSMLFAKGANSKFIADYSFKYMLYSIPATIVVFIIEYYLIKIFQDFSEDKIFEIKNFKRGRLIGIFIILCGVLDNVADYIACFSIDGRMVNGIEFHTSISSAISTTPIVLGAMIIIVSEIFRRAVIIKNEQDLTI